MIVALSCGFDPLFGQKVTEANGNLFLTEASGLTKQLTNQGKDYDPSLSPDGTMIVFARKTKEVPDPNGPMPNSTTMASQIWAIKLSEPEAPYVIFDHPATVNAREFHAFHSPKLSPANDRCYFLIDFSVVSSAIMRLDLVSRIVDLFAVAENFQVVKNGQYAGDLILQQRRAKLAVGYYEWFYLFTPDGKEAGVVGSNKSDVNLFLETFAAR